METIIVVTVNTGTSSFATTFDLLDLGHARAYAMHWQRTYGYGSVAMETI